MFAFMVTGSIRKVAATSAESKAVRMNSVEFHKSFRPRYRGIFRAAERLGVTPQHLRLVLNGERQSRRLLGEVKRRFPGLLGVEKVG